MNTTPTQLDQLRAKHAELTLQREMADLQESIRIAELAQRVVESEWGEPVNRRDYLTDTPGWGNAVDIRVSQPSDRYKGKCTPFFENEQDLANIRGIARHLAGSYEVAINAMENLTNYTLGTGFAYSFVPCKDTNSPEGLAKLCDVVFKEWATLNSWYSIREAEIFQRAHRDGESFVWLKDTPRGPIARIIEPDFVTEPNNPAAVESYIDFPGLCWSFGVASESEVETDIVHGYFVQPYNTGDNWDFVPTDEMSHIKLNVDTGVKRGISDFYAVYQNLERAAKLLGNTTQGAAIQAAIAFIKEHVPGTSGDAMVLGRNSRASGSVSYQTTAGSRTDYYQKFRPGQVIETVGTKYISGPLGQNNSDNYISVVQAALRMVGARWQMPEYMISGDASNANYSSTLVAGSPFDRATTRRQARFRGVYETLIWKAMNWYAKRGRFSEFGIKTADELKTMVDLNIEAEPAFLANKTEQHTINKDLFASGILSKQGWADREGIDLEAEQAKTAEETPVDDPIEAVPPVTESRLAQARDLLWGDYPGGMPLVEGESS